MDSVGLHRLRRPRPQIPRAGDMLVAAPSLVDPNFRRALVYMLQHDEEGSAGVIINRGCDVAVTDLDLPKWARSATIRAGGPVATNSLLAVSELGSDATGNDSLGGPGVQMVDLDEAAANPPGELALFVGYAGWSAGQLMSEIERDDWHVVSGRPADLFSGEPELLWSTVLRRQADPTRLWSTLPEQPAAN
ncbi:MAG: YqgE/AlgH family protein [Actinomycetia bacterium]|nr:YqgE/AlgH family protein [Actinomycetes bacterium]MCH9800373.1 YqgE/AlgH family protein [Actinomycetes bacterium]